MWTIIIFLRECPQLKIGSLMLPCGIFISSRLLNSTTCFNHIFKVRNIISISKRVIFYQGAIADSNISYTVVTVRFFRKILFINHQHISKQHGSNKKGQKCLGLKSYSYFWAKVVTIDNVSSSSLKNLWEKYFIFFCSMVVHYQSVCSRYPHICNR